MRGLAVVTALVTGCTFTTNEAGQTSDPGHGGPTGGSAPDGGAPVAEACPSDVSLMLCFDFEAATLGPTLADGSPRGHDATTTDIHPMARLTEQAAAVKNDSQIYVAPSYDLSNFLSLTQEAWIRPDTTGTGAWAINHQPEYGLAYDGETALCQIGNQTASVAFHTAPGTWTHLGCIYDGDQIKLFVNGSVVACSNGPGSLDGRTFSTYIGPQLVGGIDNVRIYDAGLSAQEICDHAGATGCSTSCPE